MIIQAGQSGRGKQFGARWGDLIFLNYPNIEIGKKEYAAFKADVAKGGRDPEHVKITPAIYTVAAATKSEAEDKYALIEKLPTEGDALSLLSEALNFDFATKEMDEAFTDDELAGISGLQAIRNRVIELSGKTNPTVRDFVDFSQRGRPRDPIVGGPKEVADKLEEWFVERACDGFVFAASYVPGSYEDIVNHVVPELQRRGLYHKDYAGTTLRENIGVPVPPVRDWSGAA